MSSKRELYGVLGLQVTVSEEEIKKAYYRLALLHHPDRNSSLEAKETFQLVGQAYEVLSDPARRRLYDETGVIETGKGDEATVNWGAYFRELFQRVTFADLDAFKATYIGSAEEYEDVLAGYMKHRGDIAQISESVFFGDVESESRYLEIIKRAISKGIVPQLDAYQKIFSDDAVYRAEQRKRKKRAEREAVEAAELAMELGLSPEGKNGSKKSLTEIIQARQKGRFDALIANLESKYSPKSKTSNAAATSVEGRGRRTKVKK